MASLIPKWVDSTRREGYPSTIHRPINLSTRGHWQHRGTASNCDTAVGGVGAIMLQLLIHNYVLQTHRETHTRIRAWVYNSSIHSVHQGGPTVELARRANQSPGRLVDEDGLRGSPSRTCSGQLQVRVRAAWPSLCGSLFASRNSFTVYGERIDGLRFAHQVRHWSFRHSVYI